MRSLVWMLTLATVVSGANVVNVTLKLTCQGKPVPYTEVELREHDYMIDDIFPVTKTDANGMAVWNVEEDDGLFDKSLELYIQIYKIDCNGFQHDCVVALEVAHNDHPNDGSKHFVEFDTDLGNIDRLSRCNKALLSQRNEKPAKDTGAKLMAANATASGLKAGKVDKLTALAKLSKLKALQRRMLVEKRAEAMRKFLATAGKSKLQLKKQKSVAQNEENRHHQPTQPLVRFQDRRQLEHSVRLLSEDRP